MVEVSFHDTNDLVSLTITCDICNKPVGTKAWLLISDIGKTILSACEDCFFVRHNGKNVDIVRKGG